MSAKAISEASGKGLLNKFLNSSAVSKSRFVSVPEKCNINDLLADNPWLKTEVSNFFKL